MELGSQEQGESSKGQSKQEKKLKSQVWENEPQESITMYDQKGMAGETQKRGGKALPTCLCKNWKECLPS